MLVVYDEETVVINESIQDSIPVKSSKHLIHPFVIGNPKLWDGLKNPFLYRTELLLLKNGVV